MTNSKGIIIAAALAFGGQPTVSALAGGSADVAHRQAFAKARATLIDAEERLQAQCVAEGLGKLGLNNNQHEYVPQKAQVFSGQDRDASREKPVKVGMADCYRGERQPYCVYHFKNRIDDDKPNTPDVIVRGYGVPPATALAAHKKVQALITGCEVSAETLKTLGSLTPSR